MASTSPQSDAARHEARDKATGRYAPTGAASDAVQNFLNTPAEDMAVTPPPASSGQSDAPAATPGPLAQVARQTSDGYSSRAMWLYGATGAVSASSGVMAAFGPVAGLTAAGVAGVGALAVGAGSVFPTQKRVAAALRSRSAGFAGSGGPLLGSIGSRGSGGRSGASGGGFSGRGSTRKRSTLGKPSRTVFGSPSKGLPGRPKSPSKATQFGKNVDLLKAARSQTKAAHQAQHRALGRNGAEASKKAQAASRKIEKMARKPGGTSSSWFTGTKGSKATPVGRGPKGSGSRTGAGRGPKPTARPTGAGPKTGPSKGTVRPTGPTRPTRPRTPFIKKIQDLQTRIREDQAETAKAGKKLSEKEATKLARIDGHKQYVELAGGFRAENARREMWARVLNAAPGWLKKSAWYAQVLENNEAAMKRNAEAMKKLHVAFYGTPPAEGRLWAINQTAPARIGRLPGFPEVLPMTDRQTEIINYKTDGVTMTTNPFDLKPDFEYLRQLAETAPLGNPMSAADAFDTFGDAVAFIVESVYELARRGNQELEFKGPVTDDINAVASILAAARVEAEKVGPMFRTVHREDFENLQRVRSAWDVAGAVSATGESRAFAFRPACEAALNRIKGAPIESGQAYPIVETALRNLPDALDQAAKAVLATVRRANNELAVDQQVKDQIQRTYDALARAIQPAAAPYVSVRKHHSNDMKRNEEPRANESWWNSTNR